MLRRALKGPLQHLPQGPSNCSRHILLHKLCTQSRSISNSAQRTPLLQHQHLKGHAPGDLTAYDTAQAIQEDLRARFLSWKSLSDDQRAVELCPRPQLLSFEATPTYTLGRRQDDLLPEQASRLQSPLSVSTRSRYGRHQQGSLTPEVRKTNRGGLTTYHGPGQIVFWPVIDMHSPLHAKFGVASYAALLESTTMRLLLEVFGLATYTTRDEPGVWAGSQESAQGGGPPAKKIAALGVHHRRYVTALGIALNVDVPVKGGEDVNPWARFVPCGLEGKAVTSVAAELESRGEEWKGDVGIEGLAKQWAAMFEQGLLQMSRDKRSDVRVQR